MLVDDQRAPRQLLRAFLLRIGVGQIEEASDSLEALRILMLSSRSQTPFDGIFINRTLREMDGLELVQNIRQLVGWQDFPIVVISEDTDAVHARENLEAGANEYLLRPYLESDLRAILDKLFPP